VFLCPNDIAAAVALASNTNMMIFD